MRKQVVLGIVLGLLAGGARADELSVLQKEAESGKAEAQYELGVRYSEGNGVPENPAEAAKWYHKAAEQAYAEAEFTLGHVFEIGLGVRQDDAQAAEWYKKAAAHGHPFAQDNLDVLYAEKRDTPPSEVEAQLRRGDGAQPARVNREADRTAAQKSQEAARKGDVQAQLALGLMYTTGQGVPRNWQEAAKWFLRAADQGHPDAQYNLGLLLANGEAGGKDLVQAGVWFSLAQATYTAKKNGAAARKAQTQLLQLRDEMSEAQVKIMELRVKNWMR